MSTAIIIAQIAVFGSETITRQHDELNRIRLQSTSSGTSEALTFDKNTNLTSLAVSGTAVTSPGAPSNLAVINIQSGSATYTWTDNASNESGFLIERRVEPSGLWTPISAGGNQTSITDSGLTPSTTYRIRLSAQNAAGFSSAVDTTFTTAATGSLPATLAFSAAGGSSSIPLASGTNWLVETGLPAWLSASVQPEGAAFTLLVTAAANPAPSQRTANLTLHGGAQTWVIAITQGAAALAEGALDPGFGSGGMITTTFGGADEQVEGMRIQSDGKIVVAGWARVAGAFNLAVARYTGAGTLDENFNGTGMFVSDLGSTEAYAFDVVLDGEERIVLAGFASVSGKRQFALVRLLPNGTPDSSFDSDGIVTTPIGTVSDIARAVIIQPDGKIVAAGASTQNGNGDFALVRYLPDGSLDPTFGVGGKVVTANAGPDNCLALALQPDGKIVAAGSTDSGNPSGQFALHRYLANGTLDPDFGAYGITVTNADGGSAHDVAITPYGGIVATGYSATHNFLVFRYLANGAMDNSFGISGRAATPFLGDAYALALLPDGRIIVAGDNGGIHDSMAVVRYSYDGVLDASFGSGGMALASFGPDQSIAKAVGVQPDGMIVAAGYSVNGPTMDFAVARFAASFEQSNLNASYQSSSDIPVTANHYTAAGNLVNLNLQFAPATGTRLTVIENTGLDHIQGTFVNLTQGQQIEFIFNEVTYRFVANYFGGDGNDLELLWADTEVIAWGSNEYGQLGRANIENSPAPAEVSPAGALSGKCIVSLASGAAHNLALCSDGTLAAWGRNEFGQLGDGTMVNSSVPVPVQSVGALAGRRIIAIAAGQEFSLCLCMDGSMFAWGKNYNGQLGGGDTVDRIVPHPVDMTGVLSGKKVVAIAAGGFHGHALCSDGTLSSWGWGFYGQLGNNSNSQSSSPVAINSFGALTGKSVVGVAAGWHHSVARLSDGSLVAWGANNEGQLGTQTAGDSWVPLPVVSSGVLAGRAVVEVAAGGNHNLALCTDGTLASWGYNFDGELGNGSTTNSTVPLAVTTSGVLAGRSVAAISAGLYHSTAWCSDGTLVAWGRNNQGQLGSGVVSPNSLVPVQADASALEAGSRLVGAPEKQGYFHSLSLVAKPPPLPPSVTLLTTTSITGTSAVLNARVNANGALTQVSFDFGPGAIYDKSVTATPPTVDGSSDTLVSTTINGLAPGASYICRVVAVSDAGTTTSAGQVFTTLSNHAALAGLTAGEATLTPGFSSSITNYSASVTNSTSFLSVSPTAADANALIEVNGSQVPSGVSSSLIGLPTGTSTVVVRVTSPDGSTIKDYVLNINRAPLLPQFFTENDVPVTTSNYIASGLFGAPALHFAPAPGTVLTIVKTTGPGLIQGAFSNLVHGQPLSISRGGLTYRFVANYFGGDGNDLVLQWANTRIYAWGDNESGQLGTSSITSSPLPTPVFSGGVLLGKTVVLVVAGKRHNLALCSDGKLVAWGKNTYGQLGDGTVTDSVMPVAVSTAAVLSGKQVVSMAAGEKHSLALCSDGTLVAWGNSAFGQLGDGSTTGSLTPIAVNTTSALNGKIVVSVSAGAGHSLALCTNGTLVAWGWNDHGQLGINSLADSVLVPTQVDTSGVLGSRTVISVSTSDSHTLALCSDGSVLAWGSNIRGQLGNNTSIDSRSPILVNTAGALSGKTAVQTAAGHNHSLATFSDGTVAAWGWNEFGQVGDNSILDRLVPVPVSTSSALSGKLVWQVSAGHAHSQAICSDGSLAAWGWGSHGQLGNNETLNKLLPVLVSTQILAPGERFMRGTAGQGDYHSIGLVASLPSPSTPHESWRQSFFGVADNNGDAADLTDFDQDGLANLIEYAFGLNPTQNSAGQIPQGQMVGAEFVISFAQPPGVTGITYGAEWSATMMPNDWHPITDSGTPPQHTFSVPIAGSPQLFMRLKVTSP